MKKVHKHSVTICYYICSMQTADVTLVERHPLTNLDVDPQIEQAENLSNCFACKQQNKCSVMYALMKVHQQPSDNI